MNYLFEISTLELDVLISNIITSYCSYARPAQPGLNRWLGPKQAQLPNRTEAVRFGN